MRQQIRSKTVSSSSSQKNKGSLAHENPTRRIVHKQAISTLSALVVQARKPLEEAIENSRQLESAKDLVVFFSFTNALERATVVQFSGSSLSEIWKKFADWQQRKFKSSPNIRWLRIDWVTKSLPMAWGECIQTMQSVKRNYFRYGISLDTTFKHAFLEQEINANAMLYLGANEPRASLNKKNFEHYGLKRYGKHFKLPFSEQHPTTLFTTQAIFLQPDTPYKLLHDYSGGKEGRHTGRRVIEKLDAAHVESLVGQSSQFLADQVNDKGRFVYGIHPCFDRDINAYNTLRHASTTYSMLEAWEVTQSDELKSAIDRSLSYLVNELIRTYTLQDGTTLAYLQDANKEIKLGGNAVCLLALVKYTELTHDQQYLPLLEQLALGIQQMQNAETGQFSHVLHANDLSIKEAFRIIYYDGEAAFGLMRLYGLTKDERWLQTVEKAFEYFIEKEHWKIHDHWLSYCVNELTLYRPEERYYQFGIKNVAGHLDFVIGRITTFPTLLELMMAAHKMIVRLQQSDEHRHMLDQLDIKKFYRALETRAHYLLNGFFWPEMAMYFKNPQRIVGSFFIRHHSFRVRIDDVEHYLSGYVAYLLHYLQQPEPQDKGRLSTPSAATSNTNSPTTPSATATLAWGGDVNLGRRQHYRTQEIGYEQVLDIPELKNSDLSVVNLECVVSTLGEQGISKGEGGPYYYRARPEMLKILTATNINAVTVANNHSGDYGPEALMQQQALLQKLGIACAGSGYNRASAFSPVYCQAGKLKVALFSVDATQHRFAAQEDQPGAAYLPLQDAALWHKTFTLLFAEAKKQANLVIIAVHWGPNHAPAPEEDEISVGHALINAGADAILGASSHRLQGIEIYRNKPIIHDAGDLLFDSVRSNLAGSGIFCLGLSKQGVRWVEFIPIGVGYGYSQRLQGEAAQTLISRYQHICHKLGTVLHRQGERALVELLPAESPPQPKASPQQPSYQLDVLNNFQPTAEYGQVAGVPEDAQITPVDLNGLTLIGLRAKPHQITRRQMLWIETWWTCTQPLNEDRRLSLTAVPQEASKIPEWGRGMDHDPCDWMQPTSRWQPGQIYRDYYGLRPPQMRQLENHALQLEIRVLGTHSSDDVYLYPKTISIEIPSLPASQASREYRTDFTGLNLQVASGQTWTAEQLTQITGGKWLVPPPKGWFVRSVVNGKKHIPPREAPVLFVAHTNHDRAFHEGSTEFIKGLGDRHLVLKEAESHLAGAIVSKPVKGLAQDFPLLQVKDPIKAIIELGFAARQRYQGPVIAVTGTAGKSSTIGLLETLFEPGHYLKSLDNYNSRVGVPVQLASLAPDHQAALVEVAQSSLWMQRGPITRQVKPTIALVTEVGLSQTTRMVKTTEDTAKWKARIFDGLTEDGVAVVGEHLLHFNYVLQQAQHYAKRVITFGPSEQAFVQIKEKHIEDGTTRLTVGIEKQDFTVALPFTSTGMLNNALATLTVAYVLGMDLNVAANKMAAHYVPDEGRMEEYTVELKGSKVQVIDDSWNATVLAMLNAFSVLKNKSSKGQKIAVLGRIVHLGDQTASLHASLAKPLIETGVDLIITHGEEMKYLREQLPENLLGPHFATAAELFTELKAKIQTGDLVLLKGSRRNSDFGELSAWLKESKITNK